MKSLKDRLFGFTLMEFLVASFLGTLLLILLYQAFAQVTRHFRLLSNTKPLFRFMEKEALKYQLTHLNGAPSFKEGRLILPVISPVGPVLAIYDLQEGSYTEKIETEEDVGEETPYIFQGVGLKEIKLFLLVPPEAKELPPEGRWPQGKPLLLEGRFLDGEKVVVEFTVPSQKGRPAKPAGPSTPPANPFQSPFKGQPSIPQKSPKRIPSFLRLIKPG